jgi:electron transfer flavoprotein alpha subunit
MNERWIVITDAQEVASVRSIFGAETQPAALVVGTAELAQQVSKSAVAQVVWVPSSTAVPAEAFAQIVGKLVADRGALAVAAGTMPASRVLLGAAAEALKAASVSSIIAISGDARSVVRSNLDGRVLETLAVIPPVAVTAGAINATEMTAPQAPIEKVDCTPQGISLQEKTQAQAASGIANAQRVVSMGRGVKAKKDIAIIADLATALNAEVGCSMPVADDLGWIQKDHYVGRSGQHITPMLYLAVGISGAAQHLEGIRGAKVVVAINNDPDASIFRRADYGIVGDLYEVVPALTEAIKKSSE